METFSCRRRTRRRGPVTMTEPIDRRCPKLYIGDGVYIDFDGYALVLTTEDGVRVTNRIVLEPEVYRCLLRYVEVLKREPPGLFDR
jgi:hypothetical protein